MRCERYILLLRKDYYFNVQLPAYDKNNELRYFLILSHFPIPQLGYFIFSRKTDTAGVSCGHSPFSVYKNCQFSEIKEKMPKKWQASGSK